MRPVLAALVAAVALLGCGEGNKLKQGTVIAKSYDDPDTWWSTVCVARNKDGWCTLSMPVEEHDGPHWRLQVRGYDEDGKEREEWHGVTETLYDLGDVGVVVNFPEDRVVPR